MKYCINCLEVNTRPNTKFDENGLCPACNYFSTLKDVDWDEREKELKEIVAFGKKKSSSGHDCIIGVSGGKDSTRQAVFVKEQLGMNPLLVCLNYPPQQVSQLGVDNLSNLSELGFDIVTIQPSPVLWRDLMKKGFLKYGNWAKSTEYSLFSSVPRLAIAHQIPLIWWGENPGLQLGDMNVVSPNGGDGSRLKYMNTLGGGDVSWLLGDNVSKNKILQYTYPSDEEMQRAGLRIVYLGYYWRNWSLIDNAMFSVTRGLGVRRSHPQDIGDLFGVTALDEDWMIVNQMIKYLKFGFGRATENINENIRLGKISRKEAIELLEKYDGKCAGGYIESFCKYLEISISDFWNVVDGYVNKALFEKDESGHWIKKFKVGEGL